MAIIGITRSEWQKRMGDQLQQGIVGAAQGGFNAFTNARDFQEQQRQFNERLGEMKRQYNVGQMAKETLDIVNNQYGGDWKLYADDNEKRVKSFLSQLYPNRGPGEIDQIFKQNYANLGQTVEQTWRMIASQYPSLQFDGQQQQETQQQQTQATPVNYTQEQPKIEPQTFSVEGPQQMPPQQGQEVPSLSPMAGAEQAIMMNRGRGQTPSLPPMAGGEQAMQLKNNILFQDDLNPNRVVSVTNYGDLKRFANKEGLKGVDSDLEAAKVRMFMELYPEGHPYREMGAKAQLESGGNPDLWITPKVPEIQKAYDELGKQLEKTGWFTADGSLLPKVEMIEVTPREVLAPAKQERIMSIGRFTTEALEKPLEQRTPAEQAAVNQRVKQWSVKPGKKIKTGSLSKEEVLGWLNTMQQDIETGQTAAQANPIFADLFYNENAIKQQTMDIQQRTLDVREQEAQARIKGFELGAKELDFNKKKLQAGIEQFYQELGLKEEANNLQGEYYDILRQQNTIKTLALMQADLTAEQKLNEKQKMEWQEIQSEYANHMNQIRQELGERSSLEDMDKAIAERLRSDRAFNLIYNKYVNWLSDLSGLPIDVTKVVIRDPADTGWIKKKTEVEVPYVTYGDGMGLNGGATTQQGTTPDSSGGLSSGGKSYLDKVGVQY